LKLTVITNSLPVVNALTEYENIELIVIGGMLRTSEYSMVGHIAEHAIKEFRADRVFIGMHAIDVRHGFTNDFLPEVMTDRAILEIALQIVIVSDSSKFGRTSSVLVAPITAADLIITDVNLESEMIEEIQKVIDAIAVEKGFIYILNQTTGLNILYGLKSLDITTDLAQKLGIVIPE